MRRWILAVAACVLLAVAGCGGSNGASETVNDDRRVVESAEHGFTMKYDDERFTVMADVPLTPMGALSTGESGVYSMENVIGLIDQDTPKNAHNQGGSFALTVLTMKFDMSRSSVAMLKEYIALTNGLYREKMPLVTLGDAVPGTLGGQDAWEVPFKGKVSTGGMDIQGVYLMTLEGTHIYGAQLSSTTDVWAAEEPALRELAKGLTITPVEPPVVSKTRTYSNKKFGVSVRYPSRMSQVNESATGKKRLSFLLSDTVTSFRISFTIIVEPSAFTTSNAESVTLDYGPVKNNLEETKGVSKVTTPTRVIINGKHAWQYDYTVTSEYGVTRFRNLDFWDGDRTLTLMLSGRPDHWHEDVTDLMAIAKTLRFK